MRSARLLLAGVTLAGATMAVFALAACGGTTQTTGSADGAADGTTDAVSDDAGDEDGSINCFSGFGPCDSGGDEHIPLVACAPTPPDAGTPCGIPGEVCEYGQGWWLECNLVLRCAQGAWQNEFSGTQCPWLDAGTAACPATWAEATAIDASSGGPCPAADCQYPEGYCECGGACGGGGAAKAPYYGLAWSCTPGTTTCPSPRPRSGTPCSVDAGTFCTYGWACGCGQDLQCIDGVWQGSILPPCP